MKLKKILSVDIGYATHYKIIGHVYEGKILTKMGISNFINV